MHAVRVVLLFIGTGQFYTGTVRPLRVTQELKGKGLE